jgi:uncharacterized protein YwqG
MFLTKSDLVKALEEAGLSEWKEELLRLARQTATLVPVEKIREAPLGGSRLGGEPDLPRSITWPIRPPYAETSYQHQRGFSLGIPDVEAPLPFIAQINLGEVRSKIRLHHSFPERGMLYFFYDTLVEPWGFDPGDFPGWKVIYWNGVPSELERRQLPESFGSEDQGPVARFHPTVVAVMPCLTMPDMFAHQIEEMGDREPRDYEDFAVNFYSDRSMRYHWLGGYAATIQGSMERGCQLASNGIYCGSSEGHDEQRERELLNGKDDWLLLLQIDSDETTGMTWGAFGRLYFWIRDRDLAAGYFDKVWTILQCT